MTTTKTTAKKVFPQFRGVEAELDVLLFLVSALFSDTIAPLQYMVPYLQPNGQAVVGLNLWFQRDLLTVTKVSPLFFLKKLLSSAKMRFFFTDHLIWSQINSKPHSFEVSSWSNFELLNNLSYLYFYFINWRRRISKVKFRFIVGAL